MRKSAHRNPVFTALVILAATVFLVSAAYSAGWLFAFGLVAFVGYRFGCTRLSVVASERDALRDEAAELGRMLDQAHAAPAPAPARRASVPSVPSMDELRAQLALRADQISTRVDPNSAHAATH